MQVVGYLCFGGIEILNDMRTLTYMRRGLIDSRWSTAVVSSPAPESGYTDVYGDEYQADPFWPGNLAVYCHAIDFSAEQAEGGYVAPDIDTAPWFHAQRSESGDFFGLMLLDLDLESVLTRAVNVRGPVGASLGRMLPKQRALNVSAVMFASSDCGMEYGERWITDVLAGNQCDSLSDLIDLVLLPCCPSRADEDRSFRTLRPVGCVAGPTFVPLGQSRGAIPECVTQEVDFTLVAGLPWLFAAPTVLASGLAGTLSGLATTQEWLGDAGVRITIEPSSDFVATITATPLAAGETCPTTGANPALAYTVSVPGGNTWVFDSAAHSLLEFDVTKKQWQAGLPRLTVPGPFDWIEIPPCSSVCVSVVATRGAANVTIEQINREL